MDTTTRLALGATLLLAGFILAPTAAAEVNTPLCNNSNWENNTKESWDPNKDNSVTWHQSSQREACCDPTGAVCVQVVRSCSGWSNGSGDERWTCVYGAAVGDKWVVWI